MMNRLPFDCFKFMSSSICAIIWRLMEVNILVTNRKHPGAEDSPVPSSLSGWVQSIFVCQHLTNCYRRQKVELGC